jgi:hypothetical protein
MGNAGERDVARDRRVSEAFRRAVAREHEAIARHEDAAKVHETFAAELEGNAESEPDAEAAARYRGGRTSSVHGRRLLVCALRALGDD